MALRDIGYLVMGDVFMAGAEVPLADEPWARVGTDVTRVTTAPITGLARYHLAYGTQAAAGLQPPAEGYSGLVAAYGTGWFVSTWRLWWLTATPAATLNFARVHWTNYDIYLTWESDGYVRFRLASRTGDIKAAAANPFTLQTIHNVELKWDPDGATYGRLTFSVDGAVKLTFDPASDYGSLLYPEWGGGSDKNVNPNTSARVDDIFFTRIAALEPPDGDAPLVLHGYPNGAGTHNDWSGTYEDWDDAAAGGANDGDTTHRATTAAGGVKEATDLATDFWGNSYDDMYGVMLVSVLKRPSGADPNEGYLYAKVGADEEGVGIVSSGAGAYEAVYASYDKQPDQSSAWTAAAVTALEIGMYRKDVERDWRSTEVYYYVASLTGTPPTGMTLPIFSKDGIHSAVFGGQVITG